MKEFFKTLLIEASWGLVQVVSLVLGVLIIWNLFVETGAINGLGKFDFNNYMDILSVSFALLNFHVYKQTILWESYQKGITLAVITALSALFYTL